MLSYTCGMMFYEYTTLSHLHRLLKSQAISAGIIGFSLLFIFSMNLAILTAMLISAIAIPCSFYMLFVLYRYEKKEWITGFFIWMGISFIPLFLIPGANLLLMILKFMPLLFFVLYTLLLKEKAGEWLIEMEFERESVLE